MGLVGTAVVVERDDEALVADVRSGDDRAFEELYTRYRRRIAAYVQGMVGDHARAEDITQEVFISALRRMRDTERSIAFKPWIYEIAKNACIDAYRRSRRAEEVSLDADVLAPADYGRLAGAGPSPESAVEGKQRLGDLCSAFGGLSAAHHEILVLRELEGLSYREIGERMGLSRPSVESTLFRARRRLTEEYDDLASGRRCVRIQAMIEGAAPLGVRDRRRMARHLSCCQSCRRHARVHGLEDLPVRQGLAARVAAFLPLPFLLRRFRGGGGDSAAASTGGHASSSLAQAAANLAPSADQLGGWSKAAIVAASLAVAGAGAGVATRATSGSVRHRSAPPATVVGHARRAAPAARRTATVARHRRASAARGHVKRAGRLPATSRAATAPTGASSGPGAVPPTSSATTGSSSPSGSGGTSGSGGHAPQSSGTAPKLTVPKLPLNVHVKLPDSTTQALQDPVGTTTQDVQKTVDTVTQTVGGLLQGGGAGG